MVRRRLPDDPSFAEGQGPNGLARCLLRLSLGTIRLRRRRAGVVQEAGGGGIGLRRGGARALMGIVADAVLEAGGEAYGVIPQALIGLEVAHAGLTELHIVTTMHERKAKMTDLCDAFVALPGGIGTLDELFEAWSWNALGYHAKPFALLNVGGFWDNLAELMDHVMASDSSRRRGALGWSRTASTR